MPSTISPSASASQKGVDRVAVEDTATLDTKSICGKWMQVRTQDRDGCVLQALADPECQIGQFIREALLSGVQQINVTAGLDIFRHGLCHGLRKH